MFPRPLQLEALGGYIPFVDLPCERDLGELITWVVTLTALPYNCKIVPWLCCPLEIDPETVDGISISSDIDCSDPRAPIGGLIQWAMVGVSIAGFILSLLNLGECSLVQFGVLDREVPSTIVFQYSDPNAVPNPFTIWFDNLEASLQQFQQDYLKYDGNFDPDKKLIIDVVPKEEKTGEVVIGGRFLNRSPNITGEIYSGLPYLDPVVANISDYIKKQSNIHQKRRLLTKNKKSTDEYDFKILFEKDNPTPVYIDKNSPLFEEKNVNPKKRVRRDALLDVPIPETKGFFSGTNEQDDECGRNGVEMEEDDYVYPEQEQTAYGFNDDDDDDDRCFEVLSRGPCPETEIVLINPLTKKGVCGPRLCSPDRVFLFSDQMCHDPLSTEICPDGRELFSTGYGSPVCGCEDGFYERDTGKNSDDDICQPLLTEIPSCEPGKVFWFKTFNNPPDCQPDPCKGLNLNRDHSDLPYVPSLKDGNCYQIGSTPDICRSDEYFTLDLPKLGGICQTLEEAGYLELDSKTLDTYKDIYGPPISKHSNEPPPSKKPVSPPMAPLVIGQSVIGPRMKLTASHNTLVPTHVTSHSAAQIAIGGNVTVNVVEPEAVHVNNPWMNFFGKSAGPASSNLLKHGDEKKKPHRRFKRAPQPHASPGNVFEPALASCRAGAVRDINQKCRNTILPSRVPHSRPRRAVRPRRPFPSCPSGRLRNLQRRCTSSFGSVQSSIIARGLG